MEDFIGAQLGRSFDGELVHGGHALGVFVFNDLVKVSRLGPPPDLDRVDVPKLTHVLHPLLGLAGDQYRSVVFLGQVLYPGR